MVVLAAPLVAEDKRVIGPIARLHVEEVGMTMLARIDTGAAKTSLHAEQMEIVGGELSDWDDNIGKSIRFVTRNAVGKPSKIEATIADVSHIRNAQGSEDRYVVWMTIGHGDLNKRVKVTLKDRSPMDYKLLIGRDWLEGDYRVDVELPPEQ
ncbi:RimK/LysX family protein [Ferrimonas gelatinilytica]|uniref:RimK/LysX family protein n=1 Tax=Ferrimonas gelatinilytica TaxID=1255257 RepID=A0ABP9RYF8_9GAMM